MMYLKYLIVTFILGLFAILLQGTVLAAILPWYLVPNFMLSLVVFLAFYENSPFGAALAFFIGLQVDFYAGQLMLVGPTAGAFVAVFGLVASLSSRIFVESGFAIFFVTAIAGFTSNLVYVILTYEFNKSGINLIPISIVSVLITASLTPLLFRILKYLYLGRAGGIKSRSRGAVI